MLTKDLYYVAYTLVLKCFYTLWLNKRNHGRDTIGKLVYYLMEKYPHGFIWLKLS